MQVRLGAGEARLGATPRAECKRTKLGDSWVPGHPGTRKPGALAANPSPAPTRPPPGPLPWGPRRSRRRGRPPSHLPAISSGGTSPPRPTTAGLRCCGPPGPGPVPRVHAQRTSEPRRRHRSCRRARTRPQPPTPGEARTACCREACRVTDAGGPPTARRGLPLVDAGRGGAVIGPECGRGGGNKAAGWLCAKASAGGDCGASRTLPCGAAPDRGVDDVVCTGPAAPCAGPEPTESSAGSDGRAPGASCGQAALPDRCLFLRLARRRPRAVR